MRLHYFLALVLPSFARNWCPGRVPSPTSRCKNSTFSEFLPLGASIETVREVGEGECFGEDTYSNIFYGALSNTNVCRNAQDSAPCNYAVHLPTSCALIVDMGTYRFGLLMPTNWSGSLMTVGSYSYGGGINWKDMWTGPKYYNLATISTDTGHNSTPPDMRWARGNEEAQKDWGYRSIDGSTKAAKALLGAYYGQSSLKHSYFSGCSTGGRQGLKQLQLDQSLFDGLLIGAPAWNQIHMLPWITKLATINPPGREFSVYNNASEYTFIPRQIREACDSLDGVRDNIISRPDLCNITTVAHNNLSCGATGAPPDGCLKPEQVNTLIQLYQNYTISNATGQFLGFPAPEPGSEADFQVYLGPGSTAAPDGFDWQWAIEFLGYQRGYSFSDDIIADAENSDPGSATAKPGLTDWTAFNGRGGKLIIYQGLADGLIPPKSTTQYFEDLRTAASGTAINFSRYYQVPGMHHCWTSDNDGTRYLAPWMFGGIGQQNYATVAQTESILGKSDSDMLTALMNWVEGKGAPNSMLATTWNTSTTVFRKRPICPYPQRAENTDQGNIDSPNSWTCR
ncbi:Tannase/feruloyl esterase [Ampelomyces quisqualis]|uniref:Carboxylic ester hydrolase n=1 Tax=Ampelomyces quisqualis TaxID=50730 RepID=A0A6A5QYA3_AMPQU|nr:Tannase/feruloyl esterase [Ampelomyces quisqualis]